MNDSISIVKQLVALVSGTQKVPTAMIQREISDWLASGSFSQFAKSFPKQAAFLKQVATKHELLSSVAMIAIGTVIGSTLMKKSPSLAHGALADYLTSLRRSVGNAQCAPVSQAEYAELGSTIFKMDADSMERFIDWQRDFNDDQRSLVFSVLRNKSAEEIQELMCLEAEKRWDILNFIHSCNTFTPPSPESDADGSTLDQSLSEESPFLSGLRALREKLEATQANQQTVAAGEGANDGSIE